MYTIARLEMPSASPDAASTIVQFELRVAVRAELPMCRIRSRMVALTHAIRIAWTVLRTALRGLLKER